MCLYYRRKETETFKKKKTKFIIGYKILVRRDGQLISPYYNKTWKVGWNRSNRIRKTIEKDYKVNTGIHVFLNKKALLKGLGYTKFESDCSIVRLNCYIVDFVAKGSSSRFDHSTQDYNEAVFTKVYLSKAEYKRVLNEKSNKT